MQAVNKSGFPMAAMARLGLLSDNRMGANVGRAQRIKAALASGAMVAPHN